MLSNPIAEKSFVIVLLHVHIFGMGLNPSRPNPANGARAGLEKCTLSP